MSRSQKKQKFSSSSQKHLYNIQGLENIPDLTSDIRPLNSPTSKKIIQLKNDNAKNPWQNYSQTPTQDLFINPSELASPKPMTPKVSNEARFSPNHLTLNTNTLGTKSSQKPVAQKVITPKELSQLISKISNSEQVVEKTSEIYYKEHLFNTFQALKLVRSLPPPDRHSIHFKKVNLAKKTGHEDRKTLIFDLDETLVHCVERPEIADAVVGISLPNGEKVKIGINIRPFAKECLAEAAKFFEVIVFTASHQIYADSVLDYLDPQGQLIHHRLYRENCIPVKGAYIKDLRILKDRKLKNIAIVDNAAYSFAYQLENGIPIITWHDDPCDRELYNLMDYLKVLAESTDVREINREVFNLHTFYEDYMAQFLFNAQCK